MRGRLVIPLTPASGALLLFPAVSTASPSVVEFPICTASSDQMTPVVSGNFVVWADNRNALGGQSISTPWDIYGYDLAAKTEFPVCRCLVVSWTQQFPGTLSSGRTVASVTRLATLTATTSPRRRSS